MTGNFLYVLNFQRVTNQRRRQPIGAENFPQEFYRELKAFAGRELPIFPTRQDALRWLVADE